MLAIPHKDALLGMTVDKINKRLFVSSKGG
jgi:hypothetical protein